MAFLGDLFGRGCRAWLDWERGKSCLGEGCGFLERGAWFT